jgi:hypothetical protein
MSRRAPVVSRCASIMATREYRHCGGQLISRTLGGELKALGDLERELAQQ